MVSVRTSIFERPRRLPGQRRADLYTLICEEPPKTHLAIAAWRRVIVKTCGWRVSRSQVVTSLILIGGSFDQLSVDEGDRRAQQ